MWTVLSSILSNYLKPTNNPKPTLGS